MNLTKRVTNDKGQKLEVFCGYDDPLDYVFMCIYEKQGNQEKLIFDNLALTNALEIRNFSFYSQIALKDFGVSLDDEEKEINDYMRRKGKLDEKEPINNNCTSK